MADDLAQHLLSQLPMPLSLVSKQLHSVARSVFQLTLPFIAAITRGGGSDAGGASSGSGGGGGGVSPELVNAAVLLFILWLSLQIMGMASRYMYSLVVTMIKLAMIVVFTVVAVSIYSRGLVVTQQDLVGFLESVANGALSEQWDKVGHSHTAAFSPRQAGSGQRVI